MEIIKKILDTIYSSKNGMLYFYVITSVIALCFIILIIITIKKGKNSSEIIDNNEKNITEKENNTLTDVSNNNTTELNEDNRQNNEIQEDATEIFDTNSIDDAVVSNDVLENNEDKIEEEIEIPKIKENKNISNDDFLERLNALKNK